MKIENDWENVRIEDGKEGANHTRVPVSTIGESSRWKSKLNSRHSTPRHHNFIKWRKTRLWKEEKKKMTEGKMTDIFIEVLVFVATLIVCYAVMYNYYVKLLLYTVIYSWDIAKLFQRWGKTFVFLLFFIVLFSE